MRTLWFGDNRDLIKWSVLLHIARNEKAQEIVQICFLNSHEFENVTLDGETRGVPPEVIRHFRSIRSVEGFCADIAIRVFDRHFDARSEYLRAALAFIKQSDLQRVLFLDPDTGLAPPRFGAEHVTPEEVGHYWRALARQDVLVLYQHQTNRTGAPWIENKREEFASAIGVEPSLIKIAKGEAIARDVVFYYVLKP
jgi:hypothetical protein